MEKRREGQPALSGRESHILELAAQGMTDREIAKHIGIGACTVKTYWLRIRQKIGASNRTEAVARGAHLSHAKIAEEDQHSHLSMRALFESLCGVIDEQVLVVDHQNRALILGMAEALDFSTEIRAWDHFEPELHELLDHMARDCRHSGKPKRAALGHVSVGQRDGHWTLSMFPIPVGSDIPYLLVVFREQTVHAVKGHGTKSHRKNLDWFDEIIPQKGSDQPSEIA